MVAATSPGLRIGCGKDRVNFRTAPKAHQSVIPTLDRNRQYAGGHFLTHIPIVYVLTVVGRRGEGRLAVRGLFVGDDEECFLRAAELSVKVNLEIVEEPIRKAVVYLDPHEFHSTWLGNKARYRTDPQS